MRNREFSITSSKSNKFLNDQAIIEAAIDDVNNIIEAVCGTLTDNVREIDSDVWIEPYKLTLAAAVDNYERIVTDSVIDTMRENAAQLLDIIIAGLQDRSQWFIYTYRLTSTRSYPESGTVSLFLKKDRQVLEITNDDYDTVERQVSKLVNRLLQIT